MFAIQKMKVEQQLKGTLFVESTVQWLSYMYLFKSLAHFHKHVLMHMFGGLIYIDKKIGSCLGCREVS